MAVTSTIDNLTAIIKNPALIINLKQTEAIINVLANPRIRVKNREKAKILIGDKVPVVTTTATANVGVASSVSYLEVGLKLDVESTISLQDEVSMKVSLEVSNIVKEVADSKRGASLSGWDAHRRDYARAEGWRNTGSGGIDQRRRTRKPHESSRIG